MTAEWLDVLYTIPVMGDNTLQPQIGMEAASEAAVEVLHLLFPDEHLYRGREEHSAILAYVVEHSTKGKICIISNIAHMHLLNQMNLSVLIDWQSSCYEAGHITLWPAPIFKLQPFNWTEQFQHVRGFEISAWDWACC